MSEADMKSDIRRVMNRTKRRAAPANAHVIRRSGHLRSKYTQTSNCAKEYNNSKSKCDSHAKARNQGESNETSGAIMERSEGLLATLGSIRNTYRYNTIGQNAKAPNTAKKV
jgi:hypothetical protein